MDLKQLFEDFKKHVESMSDDDIRNSIKKAIEETKDSIFLED